MASGGVFGGCGEVVLVEAEPEVGGGLSGKGWRRGDAKLRESLAGVF